MWADCPTKEIPRLTKRVNVGSVFLFVTLGEFGWGLVCRFARAAFHFASKEFVTDGDS